MSRNPSCSIQRVNRSMHFRHVRLDLPNRCFEGGKGCFGHPMAVKMRCEHWCDSRVLLKANLKEFCYLPVVLKDVPPGSADPLSHGDLLYYISPMLMNLSELPENLSHDRTKHEESLSGLDVPSSGQVF
jgi:hypothetical protein